SAHHLDVAVHALHGAGPDDGLLRAPAVGVEENSREGMLAELVGHGLDLLVLLAQYRQTSSRPRLGLFLLDRLLPAVLGLFGVLALQHVDLRADTEDHPVG